MTTDGTDPRRAPLQVLRPGPRGGRPLLPGRPRPRHRLPRPNGAGKTTTLRMLLGLVRPTSGTATIGGRTYAQIRRPLRTVGAALEAASFHPGRTALDHLRLYTPQVGVPDARAGEVLELVGLSAAADRRVGGFSLGMRQRLALATTLLGDPRVLLLDEPANGLDPEGIRWLRGFLRTLAAEGRTVLVSSHVLSEVEQTVDDVVIIARGRLAHASSLPDLARMARVQVRAVSPDAAGLAALVERSAWTAHRRRRPAGGRPAGTSTPPTVGAAAFAAGVELHELTSRDPGPRGAVPPARRRRRRRARGGCLMRAALVTEYRKLVTTRLWWILLLVHGRLHGVPRPPSSAGASRRAAGWPARADRRAGRPRAGAGRRRAGRLHGRRDVRLRVPAAGRRARGRLRVPAPDHHPDAARRAAPDACWCPRRSSRPASSGLVYGVVGTLAAVGAGAAVLALLGPADVPRPGLDVADHRPVRARAGPVGDRRRRLRLRADQPGRGHRRASSRSRSSSSRSCGSCWR